MFRDGLVGQIFGFVREGSMLGMGFLRQVKEGDYTGYGVSINNTAVVFAFSSGRLKKKADNKAREKNSICKRPYF